MFLPRGTLELLELLSLGYRSQNFYESSRISDLFSCCLLFLPESVFISLKVSSYFHFHWNILNRRRWNHLQAYVRKMGSLLKRKTCRMTFWRNALKGKKACAYLMQFLLERAVCFLVIRSIKKIQLVSLKDFDPECLLGTHRRYSLILGCFCIVFLRSLHHVSTWAFPPYSQISVSPSFIQHCWSGSKQQWPEGV